MKHKRLIKLAKLAIDDLFGDTSVAPGRTVEDLADLIEEIVMKIKSIDPGWRRMG